MKKYFLDIIIGANSVVKGMWVSLMHFFRQPHTIEYPEINVEAMLPSRYRGILHVDMDICISCLACERACPINCIKIEDVKGEKTTVVSRLNAKPTPKVKYPTRFDIDIAKCMFCGLCEEPCPTGAIHHTRRFEGAVTNVADLTYSYIREEDIELANQQVELLLQKKQTKGIS